MIRPISSAFLGCMLWGISQMPCTAAEDVAIRVLNAKTGKPMKGEQISVVIGTAQDPNWHHFWGHHLVGKTDANGSAIFHLSLSSVSTIYIEDTTGTSRNCSQVEFSTAEILEKGIIAANSCATGHKGASVTAKPDEVILFARHLPWWEQGQT